MEYSELEITDIFKTKSERKLKIKLNSRYYFPVGGSQPEAIRSDVLVEKVSKNESSKVFIDNEDIGECFGGDDNFLVVKHEGAYKVIERARAKRVYEFRELEAGERFGFVSPLWSFDENKYIKLNNASSKVNIANLADGRAYYVGSTNKVFKLD